MARITWEFDGAVPVAGRTPSTAIEAVALLADGNAEFAAIDPSTGAPRVVQVGPDDLGFGATPGAAPQHAPFAALPVQAAITRLRTEMAGGMSTSVVPVSYRAGSVTSPEFLLDNDAYWSGLAGGVADAHATLQRQSVACPSQHFVLAGYSQGAMVMHRVVRMLDRKQPSLLAKVDAVLLIGDGDRVAHDRTRRFGSMHVARFGVGLAPLVSATSGSQAAKLTRRAGRRVIEVCNRDDVVCDYPGQSTAVHTAYAASTALRRAVSAAARRVLANH